jgi:transketolase
MSTIKTRKLDFGPRRAVYVNGNDLLGDPDYAVSGRLTGKLEALDLIYRTLCSILYNFVPTSGHPGGSISSGRMVQGLLYSTMNYSMSNPDEPAADILSYAAGHKAMGLYATWALRNEIFRQYDEKLLPRDLSKQLRLEDLLGFRRNPTQTTPLFKKYSAKPLDGHPSPLVPFVRLATGASGVGVGSSFGLGFAARDCYGSNAPFVHVIEGEGGLTPGRVHEALASAATAQVNNIVLHVDWNQASIDSDRVCRDANSAGDYVQWNPIEFAYLHDWNVIYVANGLDFEQILAAQRASVTPINDQPTCVVYRTIKGWQYGIEGKGSHGAGHKFCSAEFYKTLETFETRFGVKFPRLNGEKTETEVEELYFNYLLAIREAISRDKELVQTLGAQLEQAAANLAGKGRKWRAGAPSVERLYTFSPEEIPAGVSSSPGQSDTLRESLGRTLSYLNKASNGAIFVTSADLCGSTSIKKANDGFPGGFWNAVDNPQSRLMATGGICEDAAGAIMSGIAAYGGSIGAASSYGAFIAALQHIAARLHAIGQQGRADYNKQERNPFVIVCAHAGLKTGEDGPTHADPQPLQLLQENFPRGSMITLTPWDPNEMWPLVVAALRSRPAVIAPFVTRPSEKVFDRTGLGLPPASAAAKGIYAVRQADPAKKPYHGTVVIQGSGEMNAFVEEVLPRIEQEQLNMNVFYIASAELFDFLPAAEQEQIFPVALRKEAMGITGFTVPTLYRWILSVDGQRRILHPFASGRFPGSGKAHKVLEEAHLHGNAQWQAIQSYAEWIVERN